MNMTEQVTFVADCKDEWIEKFILGTGHLPKSCLGNDQI